MRNQDLEAKNYSQILLPSKAESNFQATSQLCIQNLFPLWPREKILCASGTWDLHVPIIYQNFSREKGEEPLRFWLVAILPLAIFEFYFKIGEEQEQCSSSYDHCYYMLLPLLSSNR